MKYFCNHPPKKSSTHSKQGSWLLPRLPGAARPQHGTSLAKLQESLTHHDILSAFLGISMACTLSCSSILCLSACLSSQYMSQYFSCSLRCSFVLHSLSQCSRGAFAMWVDRPGQRIWLPSGVKHSGVENILFQDIGRRHISIFGSKQLQGVEQSPCSRHFSPYCRSYGKHR